MSCEKCGFPAAFGHYADCIVPMTPGEVRWLKDKHGPYPANNVVPERPRNITRLILWLTKFECECSYDPGAQGKGAIRLGPLCSRCAIIGTLLEIDMLPSVIAAALVET